VKLKSPRQSGADRRLSLLQAALDLFSTQGYEGASTRGIAERAGVTEALLFKHFRTKQELLRSVVEEFGPRRMFATPPQEVHSLPIVEALDMLLTQYLDTFWANRAVLRLLFMATERDQAAFDELRTQFGRQTLYLLAMLKAREEAGELRPSIAAAATDMISLSISGFLQRSIRRAPEDWAMARGKFLGDLLLVLSKGMLATAQP
jgi:AcrR family transcriptional regulator